MNNQESQHHWFDTVGCKYVNGELGCYGCKYENKECPEDRYESGDQIRTDKTDERN